MVSIGAETGASHPVRVLDGYFFLPITVDKPQNFGGVISGAIIIGHYKVFSIGTEAGITHIARGVMDGYFFLPMTVNKPPDFDGAITVRNRHKVASIGTEASNTQ